ncbi:MAG: LPS export ABC transporter permease LptG [Gammaproteobacteria bacterium]|nr:LPS export ABC transporter permease LptG [Gammaproteobacteria bacterium]
MRLLDRHIGRTVITTSLIVLCVLLALFTFMTFLAELKMVGRGHYGYLQALIYVLMAIPGLCYQLMPIAALLGGLIGLGMMANQNELTVIRAAGVSRARIIQSVMQAALVLVALGFVMGQWLAPRSEVLAQNKRAEALGEQPTLQTRSGLWYRDADSFVHIRSMESVDRLVGIDIYVLDGHHHLREYRHAAVATYRKGSWALHDVLRRTLEDEGVHEEQVDGMAWNTTIEPDLLDVVAVRPESMAIWELYDYLDFLHANGLDAGRHELAFWRQILTPVTTLVMVMLSIPFVFGSLRSVSLGQRVMVGALLGISFYLLDQMSGYVGLVYDLSPLLCALAPSLVFLVMAWALLRRGT